MKFLAVTAIFLCMTHTSNAASVSPQQSAVVEEDSRYCHKNGRIFSCDFQWSKNVHLPRNAPKGTDRVRLQNIQNLALQSGSCFNLDLKDIQRAVAEGDVDDECSGKCISLRTTNIDVVDKGVTGLYAFQSTLGKLSMCKVQTQLTVVGSNIGALNVKNVVDDDITVKLHSTTINQLEHLHVAERAKVLFQSVNIESAPQHSLVLSSVDNLLIDVKFPQPPVDEAAPAVLLLEGGADVTLEGIEGSLKIAAAPCPVVGETTEVLRQTMTTARTTLNDKDARVEEQSPKFIAVMVVLAVSVSLNVFFIFFICRQNNRKHGRRRKGEIEKGKVNDVLLPAEGKASPPPRCRTPTKRRFPAKPASLLCLKSYLRPKRSKGNARQDTLPDFRVRNQKNHYMQSYFEEHQREIRENGRRRSVTYGGPYDYIGSEGEASTSTSSDSVTSIV